VHLSLVAIVVSEYDPAIDFFVGILGFDLAEPYGRVAVFLDIAGNRWDLLGPA
jgi:catechol 2,3-dioxygenase-like lactoylglutathione lyase family enzyme